MLVAWNCQSYSSINFNLSSLSPFLNYLLFILLIWVNHRCSPGWKWQHMRQEASCTVSSGKIMCGVLSFSKNGRAGAGHSPQPSDVTWAGQDDFLILKNCATRQSLNIEGEKDESIYIMLCFKTGQVWGPQISMPPKLTNCLKVCKGIALEYSSSIFGYPIVR